MNLLKAVGEVIPVLLNGLGELSKSISSLFEISGWAIIGLGAMIVRKFSKR